MLRARALAPLAVLALAACGDCGGCGDAALAELSSHQGIVERDFATAAKTWQAADVGARFALGDGLKTGVSASAMLRVFPDTEVRVESDTILRFSATAPEAPRKMSVETGSVQVETAEVALDIATVDGVARVREGSRARVRMVDDGVRFDVEVGRVEVESNGKVLAFEDGGAFELQVGKVVREIVAGGEDAIEGADDAESLGGEDADLEEEAQLDDDAPEPRGRGEWLLPPGEEGAGVLPSGESVTIHVPGGPARLFLDLPCSGPAKLDLRGPGGHLRHEPQGRVGLSLPPGGYSYRVLCPDGSAEPVRGRLRVRHDAATQRLPRTAPSATVRADGRRYTVRYQNRLPKLTFEWPDAPKASGYTLVIGEGRRSKRHRAGKPRVALASAAVRDGQHAFHFESADGKRSKQGSLRVVFDNTARTAALMSPSPSGYPAGAPTTVSGVALRGSRVQVQDEPATVTGDGRFRVEVAAPGAALLVRVQHPQSGIHYYVRQAR